MGLYQSVSLDEVSNKKDIFIHTTNEVIKPLKKCDTCSIWFSEDEFSNNVLTRCNQCFHTNHHHYHKEEDVINALTPESSLEVRTDVRPESSLIEALNELKEELTPTDKLQCIQCKEWKTQSKFIQTRKGCTRTLKIKHDECNQCRLYNKRNS